MGFVAWLALAVAILLITSAQSGRSPWKSLLAILNGEPLPDPEYKIENYDFQQWGRKLQSGDTTTGGLVTVGLNTGAGGMLRPVPGKLGDGWGAPREAGRKHKGVDLLSGMGTPIKAAAAGRVEVMAWRGGYGNAVFINHGNGVQTRYAHMSRFGTRVGANVNAGDVIGYVGSTGNSSGPHLHFEVWINGAAVDPLKYIPR